MRSNGLECIEQMQLFAGANLTFSTSAATTMQCIEQMQPLSANALTAALRDYSALSKCNANTIAFSFATATQCIEQMQHDCLCCNGFLVHRTDATCY